MNLIISYIKRNKYELIITFFIFTNLFPMQFPSFFYYIGLALIGYKMINIKVYYNKYASFFILLMVLMLFSSIINLALDLRLILFYSILILTCPIYTSYKWHLFKTKLLANFFIFFILVVIISLYAKSIGYNYQEINVGTEYKAASENEFSGFARYPMWISAASAICTVFIFNNIIINNENRKLWKNILLFLFMLSSIYLNVISASRSALAASIITIFITLYFSLEKFSTLIKYLTIAGICFTLLFPFFADNSDAMMRKQAGQERTGKTSRDALWGQRLEEFESSPLWGIGFAAHGVGTEKKVGRNESGGGWISILSQIGIIGFILIITIISKALTPKRILMMNKSMIPIYMTFLFFCMHSIFEGYMFQGGWYLCLIFWLCVGILIENKQYQKLKIHDINNHLFHQ